jgi:hypothetical protein
MFSIEFLRRSVNQKQKENKLLCECASFCIQSKPSKTTSTAASKQRYRKPLIYIEIVEQKKI